MDPLPQPEIKPVHSTNASPPGTRVVKLTGTEVRKAHAALMSLDGSTCSPQFAFAVASARRALQDVVDAYEAAFASSAEANAWEKVRLATCQQFAIKGPNNQPMIARGSYVIADQAGYAAALEAKRAENAPLFAAWQAWNAELNKLLNEQHEFTLRTLNLSQFPSGVPVNLIDALFSFIQD